MFSYSVISGIATPTYRGPLYSGSVSCQGTEWSLSECSQALAVLAAPSCPEGQAVVQCTPGGLVGVAWMYHCCPLHYVSVGGDGGCDNDGVVVIVGVIMMGWW